MKVTEHILNFSLLVSLDDVAKLLLGSGIFALVAFVRLLSLSRRALAFDESVKGRHDENVLGVLSIAVGCSLLFRIRMARTTHIVLVLVLKENLAALVPDLE